MKRVAIVVLNWNGWKDSIDCMASLQALTYGNFEILVVDNGSTDGSVAQINDAFPSVALLQTGSNLGLGGGCNVRIRHALAQGAVVVWLIDGDATVDSAASSASQRLP